jgi:hypothetical protein
VPARLRSTIAAGLSIKYVPANADFVSCCSEFENTAEDLLDEGVLMNTI